MLAVISLVVSLGAGPLAPALGVAIGYVLFYGVYRFIPRSRVGGPSARIAALVSALLWEAAKIAFGFFTRSLGIFTAYGPIAFAAAMLTWIYVTAVAHLDLCDRRDHSHRCGSDKAEKSLNMERLESFVSRLIEGWSARLFGAKLQPVQIAKRLIRTMEAHQTISLSKTFVPNSYVVSLSATDFAQFEQYRRSLERDLAEAVLSASRERNFTLLDFPSVEIERDDDVAPGDIRVSCALVDASGDEVEADPKSLGAVESGHTMVLDREKLLREKPRAPKASIEMKDGERSSVQLGPEPMLIGRDQQNDVVLDDTRVSRKHAEIRLRLGRYTLYDLQSTNGTYVNGRRVAEVVLNDGDRISVAGLDLIFHSAE